MSLDALVSLRHARETDLKKRGDILVVKLSGAPWAAEERRFHQVVQWEDSPLQRRLNDQQTGGEPIPLVTLPYATYEDQPVLDSDGNPVNNPATGETFTQRVMTNRSTEGVDVDALPATVRDQVMNKETEYRKLTKTEYSRRPTSP